MLTKFYKYDAIGIGGGGIGGAREATAPPQIFSCLYKKLAHYLV